MARTNSRLSTLIAVLAVVAMPLASYAKDDVGKAGGGGSSIDWQLSVSGHEAVDLSVLAPNGEVYTKHFNNGKTPSFRLLDLGSDVADGQYNYQLSVVPKVPNGLKKQLDAARAAGDESAARKLIRESGLVAPTQSGTFTILNGMIVNPNLVESGNSATGTRGITTDAAVARPTPKLTPSVEDQVIPDDLIVQGSACVGLDCVNNESFGFDTIRMKENNTRLHFDDTSTSAGFPANDWRLVANDSGSGGASFLAVEDSTAGRNTFIVEAGAPSNSLVVDSTGRIGIQQAAPVLDVHITTGNTPAVRFEQTSASGFTAQTWDIGANEANFFVRDVTSGSRLPFRIRPGAPTSSVDISASGNVGVGTASPEVKLHVFGSSTTDTFVGIGEDPDGSTGTQSSFNVGYGGSSFGRAAGFFNVRPDSNAVAPNPSIRFMTANTVRMIIDNEGFIGLGTMATGNPTSPIHYTNGANTALLTTAGVWQDASSRAAKEHIEELGTDAAFKALDQLNPVTYNYKIVPDDPKVGFIAEDVPDLVATPERNGLSALDIVAVVTKVVKEQQKTIEQLNERIADLEKQQNH